MDDAKKRISTIDEYVNSFPVELKHILQSIRSTIKSEAPQAKEAISYQMPTFKLRGKNLVHFAAWKTHIGFYPTPSGTTQFQQELLPYKFAKGSIQFPLDKPIPLALIQKIVAFRVKEIERSY